MHIIDAEEWSMFHVTGSGWIRVEADNLSGESRLDAESGYKISSDDQKLLSEYIISGGVYLLEVHNYFLAYTIRQ